jgi:uncharacterized protein (DUF305 family)
VRRLVLTLLAAIVLAACAGVTAHQAPAFNDTDVRFLQDMILHHRQGIEMAKLVDGRSQRPELVALATRIIASQGSEIGTMQGWLARWNRPAPAVEGMGQDQRQVPGMLALGQLDWLATLTGAQFDLGFVTMMRTHFGGGLEVAGSELRSGSSAEVRVLATRMVADQQAEIRRLHGWKDAWS